MSLERRVPRGNLFSMTARILLLAGVILMTPLTTLQASTKCANNNESVYVKATSPTNNFMIHDNGTVTDNSTGLMWMRCSLGQTWDGSSCLGRNILYTWQDALQAAASATYAGYDDWRLPNVIELESIVEQRCWSPAINSEIFPNTESLDWVWTSTPSVICERTATYTWRIDFVEGEVAWSSDSLDRNWDGAIRLVRNAD